MKRKSGRKQKENGGRLRMAGEEYRPLCRGFPYARMDAYRNRYGANVRKRRIPGISGFNRFRSKPTSPEEDFEQFGGKPSSCDYSFKQFRRKYSSHKWHTVQYC